jgi:hypothetical protein
MEILQLPENRSDMGSPYYLRIYGLGFLLTHIILTISSPLSSPRSNIEVSQPQDPLSKKDLGA